TATFAAGPARDFYLASSAGYVSATAAVGPTTINAYAPAGFEARNEVALASAAVALEVYNRRFGPYPYTELDAVAVQNLALGVEYPGVIVMNSRLYDPAESFGATPAEVLLDSVVGHEVAHQWFYSLVGNDQPDEPWLDESLTQYATYLYFLDAHGPAAGAGYRNSFLGRWQSVEQAEIPIGLPAGAYEGNAYSAIVYGRGPLFFEALSEAMGGPAFDAFLRAYVAEHSWGHASGASLQATAEASCACDLDTLFAAWVGPS
ncbi:MAG: M1 family aminopeptidase, partial [Candidatus Promineifilaceae bacterium]